MSGGVGALGKELPETLECFEFACEKQAFSRVVDEIGGRMGAEIDRGQDNKRAGHI